MQDERRNTTLCWNCKNAVGSTMCSWAKDFKPVVGWQAIRNDLKSTPGGGMVISYIVLCCPLFDPDDDLIDFQPRLKRYCGRKKDEKE